MKKRVIIIAVTLLATSRGVVADTQSRTNGIELLQRKSYIASVSSTPTNLTITFRLDGFSVRRDGKTRGTSEYIKNNEALIVTPDQEVGIYEYGSGVTLTPISFKSGEKGLRIMDHFNAMSVGGGIRRKFAYIALGDAPMPMSIDDVEMIFESHAGHPIGWKRFEPKKEVEVLQIRPEDAAPPPAPQETPPEPPAVVPPEPVETPDIVAEDEGRAKPSPPSRLWLYVLIPLCLFTIFYFMRRKKANN